MVEMIKRNAEIVRENVKNVVNEAGLVIERDIPAKIDTVIEVVNDAKSDMMSKRGTTSNKNKMFKILNFN